MVLRARDVMSRRVVTVTPETPIDRARTVLTENRFSALPVVDDRHRLVGLVTTFDLLRAATSPESRRGRIGAVMTRIPMVMVPDADVRIIAHRLRHYGELRAMPIVERGVLVGIVTRGDLLRPALAGGPVGRSLHRLRHPARPRHTWWGDGTRRGRTAADVMTPVRDVVSVDETTPTAVAATLLPSNRFTALPVLDGDDHAVGVLSEADLVPDRLSGRRTPTPRTVAGAMPPTWSRCAPPSRSRNSPAPW